MPWGKNGHAARTVPEHDERARVDEQTGSNARVVVQVLHRMHAQPAERLNVRVAVM